MTHCREVMLEELQRRNFLGGQLKTGHRWTAQNRPFRRAIETGDFYFDTSSVRKSVCTFVRQLRGPHLRTCA